jgi:16S rRNA (uracil1498-N3)-methyltransferase
MRIPRVFTFQALASGQTLLLEEAPSHHLAKVLRMQPGRGLVLFNGQGGEFKADILALHKKQVEVQVGEFSAENHQSPLALELAIGLSRGDRLDWVLQKATELGVTKISLLLTARTEVKLTGERLHKKREHWQQILISACEQCQRNLVPELADVQTLDEWLTTSTAARKFVLHHRDNRGLPAHEAPTSVALLIGPEGGLSDDEIQRAQAAGCAPLTLGPRILRTETAPLTAISLVQYVWGDLRSPGS